MVLVLTGRVLARTGFVRLISPERVLLIGTGRASGALIEKMRAKASLRLEPIGMVNCREDAGRCSGCRGWAAWRRWTCRA
jgi:hypothetical protein